MDRSTYLTLSVTTFALILLTFIVRGVSRLVVGDRWAALLSLPMAAVAGCLLLVLVALAIADRSGVWELRDDLSE